MSIFREFARHNLITIYTKTHQTAPYFEEKKLGDLADVLEPPSTCV